MKIIPLTRGMLALVDDEDYDRLSRFKWYAQRSRDKFYAARRELGKLVLMHRDIMNPQDGLVIDHREVYQTLNNQKDNLRIATHAQNHQNAPKRKSVTSSRFKGVCKFRNKWQAYIQVSGKKINLGTYSTEKEAALAYNSSSLEHFGEFAKLNWTD